MVNRYLLDCRYLSDEFDSDFVNLSLSRSMDEVGKGRLPKISRFLSSYCSAFGKLIRNKYDFCYIASACHGKAFLKDAPFALLCKAFRCKLVIHQHNKGMSDYVARPLFRFLYRKVYEGTNVILLSWNLYPDIEAIVDRNQVMICPNGIPDQPVPAKHESMNGIPQLLFVSNLMISKGPLLLLDACKMLAERGFDFVCNIVGATTSEISEERICHEISSRQLDDKVFYLGPLYGVAKETLLCSSDIFVHPTLNDCFPLVILEAMQHGMPVIASDEGGISDMVEDSVSGFLIEKGSVISLADSLARMLANPSCISTMGQAGYDLYQSKFTLRIFENTILDIFRKI